MSSTTKISLLDSFSFRLTLWYTIFFIISLIIIFLISYRILVTDLGHVVDRSLLAQTDQIESEFNTEGLDKVRIDIRENIEEEGKNRIFYRLLSSKMQVLSTSDPLKWPCLNFPQMSQWALQADGGNTIYQTIAPHDRNYKIRIISRGIFNGQYVVQIGKTMKDEEELMSVYRKVFGGSLLLLLICGIFLSWIEAKKAMRRIEALMKGLQDVTDNIAHDLRTPITRIRGMAEMDNSQESRGAIIEECDRLVSMINIMLEIAQADAGLKNVHKENIDIVNLVRQGCDLFEPLAEDKDITIEYKFPANSLLVSGEPMRLQRVISNLLDNAIKFTPEGGSIWIEVKRMDAYAVVEIKDTGLGIDLPQQERIFEKFYRVEKSRSTPGHGLGLSYVRSMVLSMGGSISLQSALGQGSSFILRFPLI